MAAKLILAVDDEPLVSRLVQVNLERAGYTVETALNGVEALVRLRSGKPLPDLILSDVTMPYMDGHQFVRELKADPLLAPIPVILQSVRSRNVDIIQGQAEGAVDYITKPIDPTELLRVVNAAINQGSAS